MARRTAKKTIPPPLTERIGLRIEEAAAMIGVSERAFRTHVLSDPRCPRVYVGTAVVLPRRRFEQYLEDLSVAELKESEETPRNYSLE